MTGPRGIGRTIRGHGTLRRPPIQKSMRERESLSQSWGMRCDRADCIITSEYVGVYSGRNAPLSKVGGGVWSCAESRFSLGTMQERHKLVMAQDGGRAQCNNIKKMAGS
jgi:hypothetical protein